MVYRPTVRYDDIFKDYVDQLFQATNLDRNQILRAALFASAHSKEFQKIMAAYKKKDVTIPPAPWHIAEHGYWMEKSPNIEAGERDVIKEEPKTITFKESGGIKIQLG